jgi:probable HAF family extracellular repeat protein
MKSRTLILIAAMTFVAALAMPVRLAAQDQQGHKQEHPRYRVTDLGTLGGTFSEVVAVNNRGLVAGESTLPGDQNEHAFLWQKGVMTDLGTIGGPNSVAPEAHPLNERGAIVGYSDTSMPDPNGEDFCSDGTHLICLPFVWQKGVMTALPTLGGNNGAAGGINDRGQVVGFAENATQDPTCPPPQVLDFQAVIWGPKKGEIQELPPLPGDTESNAIGINDNGQVVGTSGNCSNFPIEAVIWQNGTPTDLGTLGGKFFNVAFAINNQGQVVGQSDLPGDTTHHAFLWTEDDGMQDLGTFLGLPLSLANGINTKGQVVGFSQDFSGNTIALLWQNGVMTDLNTLIPAGSPFFLVEALTINSRGEIGGYAFNASTGEVHAFLLTPCDENHGDSECEDEGERVAVAQGETNQRPNVVLPENARKLLQQRLSSRYHFPGLAFGPRN